MIYFQDNSVKIVSFSIYFPFSFIQLGTFGEFSPFYSVLFYYLIKLIFK